VGRTLDAAVKRTAETNRIETTLGKQFAKVEAYRYNSASIRVRVIDESFRSLSKTERERLVEPLLESLPEKTKSDIMILLLLSPDEAETSLMNLEFEHPTPSEL
jgi:hypothetical protein